MTKNKSFLILCSAVLIVSASSTWEIHAGEVLEPPGLDDDVLVYWLDAGQNVLTDEDNVTEDGVLALAWEDSSTDELFFCTDGVRGEPRLTEYSFDSGEKPAIKFDGDDGFLIDNDAGLYLHEFTVYAHVIPLTGQSQCIIADYRDVNGWGFGVSDNQAAEVKWFTAQPIDSLETGEEDLTEFVPTLLCGSYDNGVKVLRQNGAIIAESSPGSINYDTGPPELTVGNLDFGRQYFTGWITEILVYNNVDDDRRLEVESYFDQKYGVAEGFARPSDLFCDRPEVSTVNMSWTNMDVYESLEIYRDGALLATLGIDETTFTDDSASPGDHVYELVARRGVFRGIISCELRDFSTPQLTAMTFFGATADGLRNLGERWNTFYVDGAWDILVYPEGVVEDIAEFDREESYNRGNDMQLRIPLSPGSHSFGFAVGRIETSDGFYGMNLYFDGAEDLDRPAISVFGTTSLQGPFLANSATTMGWPITDVAGSGLLSVSFCDNVQKYKVELVEYEVYKQPDLNVDLLTYQTTPPGNRNIRTDPDPFDGIADLQGQFTIEVTFLGDDCTPNIAPPIAFTCAAGPEGDTLELDWVNPQTYDQIRLFKDENQIALLSGSTTTHTTDFPGTGTHVYRLQAETEDQMGGPSCSVTAFDGIGISAMSLNKAPDELGGVDHGERWQTSEAAAGWDIGVAAGPLLDAIASFDPLDTSEFWLNDSTTAMVNIPLECGEHIFTFGVDRSPLDPFDHFYYNLNIFFNSQESINSPSISVLAQTSTEGPESDGPFPPFEANASGTTGFPLADTQGSGTLLFQNPNANRQVELTDFVIFQPGALNNGDGVSFGQSGGPPSYIKGNDESGDLLGQFTLEVTSIDGSPCGSSRGVCCNEGSCDVTSEADCLARGGTYGGDGTTCEDGVSCPAGSAFRRGDCDQSGKLDFNDAIFHLRFLFLGENEDTVNSCKDACDSDDSGSDDFTDDINTLRFLFLGQGDIPAPGPLPDESHPCGGDPTEESPEELTCAAYESTIACP